MSHACDRVLDQGILSAWCEGIALAASNPILKFQLLQWQDDLLPSFADQYAKLRALPRRMCRTFNTDGSGRWRAWRCCWRWGRRRCWRPRSMLAALVRW